MDHGPFQLRTAGPPTPRDFPPLRTAQHQPDPLEPLEGDHRPHFRRALPPGSQKVTPLNAFDIIGDVHGHASELKNLLSLLGYQERGGIFSHAKRRVLFLGDLIDRGPEIHQTLDLVRSMVDSGNALCLMGNHEYNALMFDTPDPKRPGEFLRSHNAEHLRQHGKTLEAFSGDHETWESHLRWFKTLPL
ncbi:MAG: metallophosphoesterase, partial [Spirochaetia bacterium]|nr:metallophosphoesterase [Spirochaetia bacterium]